jgi:hypothetical protein
VGNGNRRPFLLPQARRAAQRSAMERSAHAIPSSFKDILTRFILWKYLPWAS